MISFSKSSSLLLLLLLLLFVVGSRASSSLFSLEQSSIHQRTRVVVVEQPGLHISYHGHLCHRCFIVFLLERNCTCVPVRALVRARVRLRVCDMWLDMTVGVAFVVVVCSSCLEPDVRGVVTTPELLVASGFRCVLASLTPLQQAT
ncbi:hypothetical protein PTSG_12551 [Salpingoeca rosetta]|uniref:Secreted protein n=1 Tax=Salpingoeca rosetta (strain ATCC 50818 / BSB-021) TaxID=946362 RepID=F2UEC6_SALR5|nr:uncharacterized protein PTSG_12551 [Salpingoeca rosetta]EGD74976.1 hypothetical protein PTSG_12551 [Salpingoeca rosetta]|eukprot:XP_004992621.1 hypothetical protein PTSG_12551 [Salpingoeca rosetta]